MDTHEKEIDGNISDHSSMGSPATHPDDPTKKIKPKQRRKRLLKDINAPKAPLTGYVRFLNEHREKFREEHPDMPFHEVTKVLGQKWTSMSQEEKQQYLEEAEKDKERYMKALEGYQQTPAYREFQMKKRKEAEHYYDDDLESTKQLKNIKVEYPHVNSPKRTPNPVMTSGPRFTSDMGSQIPIFTEPFLEYCRKRESELRQLRKNNSVFEEQNAMLNKQIDHMKNVMDRVKTEIIQQENDNLTMQSYLDNYKKDLLSRFRSFPFPECLGSEKITSENIEIMLTKLAEYIATEKNPAVNELKRKAKEVIAKIEYPTVKE